MDGAIDGMVKSLGDPHSIYMKTAMYKSLKEHAFSIILLYLHLINQTNYEFKCIIKR